MQRMMAAALGLALALVAGAAAAQPYGQFLSSPMLIEQIPVPAGELLVKRDDVFARRPMRSIRAARLDEAAPAAKGMMFGAARGAVIPAGTQLFGVEVAGTWVYCAVSEARSWLTVDETSCFGDADGDGRFDEVRASGTPYRGVPLLVLVPGAPQPLAQPAKYTVTTAAEGPSVDLAIAWQPSWIKPKRDGKTIIGGAYLSRSVPLDGKKKAGLAGDYKEVTFGELPQTVEFDGVTLEILGVTPRKELRYRILAVEPTHEERVRMPNFPPPTTIYVYY
ncbi:hypothetical protein [Caulobacter sp. 17J80-11]|uniref:hypothetical protein n=1 Tax=Caulobacter sp. 17J80-11 TaxID=2763502 RepID=UPI0016537719|nr:hypothetical protein [Caulobacter sp. 17J80-11]MBC6982393.1 hypothetical protein [Caulobacter sp. 17J80-11]